MNDIERLRELAYQLWIAEGRGPVSRETLMRRADELLTLEAGKRARAAAATAAPAEKALASTG